MPSERISNLPAIVRALTVTALLAAASAPAPAQDRVGELIEDLVFTDLDGRSGRFSDYRRSKALVLVVRDTKCPLCRKYAPRLARLEREYGARGVAFLFVNPTSTDSPRDMAKEIADFGFRSPYVPDPEAKLGKILRLRTTTEVLVLDAARTLVYRGAVDDQYAVGSVLPEPRHSHLRDALEALLAARSVETELTEAPGCVLALDLADVRDPAITYHNRISRIVQRRCAACHQVGGVAPFAFDSYEDVAGRKGMIRYVVREGIMPPWGAAEGSGPWRNDSGLSKRERAALLSWVEGGVPSGEPADAPLARTAGAGGDPRAANREGESPRWSLGEPDFVVQVPRVMEIPAEGVIPYEYEWVATGLQEDRWVRAVEFRTTAPQVVHHVLTFLDEDAPRRWSDKRRRRRGGLPGYFAGLVPGQGPTVFPPGTAKRIPAGAWIKFQLHYTANGTPTTERTSMALFFCDDPPRHELRTSSASETKLRIPPGEPSFQVRATARFRRPATLYSFAPHMHVRGKAFRYELLLPDGTMRRLLDVPRYDFNWQSCYQLKDPIDVPAGAAIVATAWFDNSENNPANPDPASWVTFGEQTWDEMMIGYFEWWRTP